MTTLDEVKIYCVRSKEKTGRIHIGTVMDEEGDILTIGLTVKQVESLISKLQSAILAIEG